MSRRERQTLFHGLAFLSPWIVGFLAFTALPVGLSLYFSFCDYSVIHPPPIYDGWNNFQQLMNDPLFWKTLRNTLYYGALSLPLGLALALGLALLLNVKVAGQEIYRTILFLPSLVPTVASAMLWMWMFNKKLGLINSALGKANIDGPGWLTEARWAMPALVLMSLWGVGNTIVIYLAGLQDVPRELYEAAHLDGAGMWDRLWHVTLPMISPVIFFNLIMAIIGIFQIFNTPYIMTPGGGPSRATYFYTVYLYENAFTFLKMGYASAMAWIQLAIILFLTAIAFWTSRRWVHYQGK